VLGIKALNLLNAGSGILGEIEDVDLAMRENDPHADRGVTQTIDAAFCFRDRIMFEPGFLHQLIELTLSAMPSLCSDTREGIDSPHLQRRDSGL